MFTGLITAVGTVRSILRDGDRLVIAIEAPWADLVPGESVAVNGACLTVARLLSGAFEVEAIATTRDRTLLAALLAGAPLNLERALAVGERLGGHFVQGHVDGVGEVVRVAPREDALLMDIRVPDGVADLMVPHGSVAVDGVSLTINDLPAPGVIQVALIPFTRDHTTLGRLTPGCGVHVEGDMLGKFVKSMLSHAVRFNR